MNRRDFTRGLATFGLVPALPLPSLGAASASTAAVRATAEKMYFMGWYTARMNKTCSPDFLIRELKVQPDVAKDIFAKLVETNTVSAPNALGVSRTLDPLKDSYRRVTGKLARDVATERPKAVRKEVRLDDDTVEFEETSDEYRDDEHLDLVSQDDAVVDVPEEDDVTVQTS